jgi:HSP20 family protein
MSTKNKDSVVVKAELPGMKEEDIQVNLAGEDLTIKGGKKEDNYYRRERSYASFLRTVALPCEVKSDEIKASFKDGVLELANLQSGHDVRTSGSQML